MEYGPLVISNVSLKFATDPAFWSRRRYVTRSSVRATSRQISAVPSLDALSEMSSPKFG